MLPRDSEDVERREVSRLAPRFHIEFRSDAPSELGPAPFCGKHPCEKKQVGRRCRGLVRDRLSRFLNYYRVLFCTRLIHCAARARNDPGVRRKLGAAFGKVISMQSA